MKFQLSFIWQGINSPPNKENNGGQWIIVIIILLIIHCYGDWKFSVPKKPNDPLFSKQWYLHNKKYPGEDINWVPVYNAGITGKDVRITIVGDGFDTEHPDA